MTKQPRMQEIQEEQKISDSYGPSKITKAMKEYKTERILMLGRSGVGKSYSAIKYITQLIKDGKLEADHTILMSKTWRSDPSQKELIDICTSKYQPWKLNNAFEEIDVEFLTRLFESQKSVKELNPNKLHNFMVILDDQISDKVISSKNPTLIQLFCVGRHFNIGMCMMLQRFRGTMNCTMRDQFTRICIFKQGNKKSLMDLLADYEESPLSPKEGLNYIYACYKDAIERDQGHGCLTINVLTSFGEGRLEIGLGTQQFYDKNAQLPKEMLQSKEKPQRRKVQQDSEAEEEDDTDQII